MLAFHLGNETKLFSTIFDTEIRKTLPGDDCSEFMLGPLSVINCFEGNNWWFEGLQVNDSSLSWDDI